MIIEIFGLIGIIATAGLIVAAVVKICDLFYRLGEAEASIKRLKDKQTELSDRLWKVERK